MVHPTHAVTYEVVQLPSGLFAVLPVGGLTIGDEVVEYATREEAENALYSVNETLDDAENNLPIIKPAGGQSVF
jgi:hypothetical protein